MALSHSASIEVLAVLTTCDSTDVIGSAARTGVSLT